MASGRWKNKRWSHTGDGRGNLSSEEQRKVFPSGLTHYAPCSPGNWSHSCSSELWCWTGSWEISLKNRLPKGRAGIVLFLYTTLGFLSSLRTRKWNHTNARRTIVFIFLNWFPLPKLLLNKQCHPKPLFHFLPGTDVWVTAFNPRREPVWGPSVTVDQCSLWHSWRFH